MARVATLLAWLFLALAGAAQASQPYIDYPIKQGDTYNASGRRIYTQDKPTSYSLQVRDHQLFRTELHKGEWAWVDDQPTSQRNRERAEYSWTGEVVPFGKAVTFESDVLMEVNANSANALFVTDTAYNIISQVHADDNVSGSPVLAIDIRPNAGNTAEMVQVDAMYATGPSPANNVVRNWPGPTFTRGMMHHVKYVFVDGHGTAAGSIHVEWDGAVILDLTGVVTGYPDAVNGDYVKFGQYRSHPVQASDTTQIVWFWAPDLTIAP